jgi:hypothetical protein
LFEAINECDDLNVIRGALVLFANTKDTDIHEAILTHLTSSAASSKS